MHSHDRDTTAQHWRGYGLALVVIAAAALLRWGFPAVLGGTPFLAFYPAVVAAAVFAGTGPAVLVTVASALCVGLLFDPTPGWVNLNEPAVLVRLGLFLLGGIGTSLAAGSMRASRAYARKQAEALRESEERHRIGAEELQAIMDAVPGGICVAHDPQCRLITGNRMAHLLLGVPMEQNISATPNAGEAPATAHFHMLRDGQELAPEQLPMQVACATGTTVRNEELEVVRSDGTHRFVLLNAAPLRWADGTVRGVVAAFTDITERKEAEEALRLNAAALEAAANGIAITNAEGTILWVNQAFCDLTGYTRAEAVGRNPRILKSGMQDETFYQEMWRTIGRGEVWHGELVNRRKDGSLYVEEMAIAPLRTGQGVILNFIAVKQDVSQRRAEQEALAAARVSAERAKAIAEQANAAKDQFLAVLSHELRTPLTPVVAAVSMLQEGQHDEHTTREALEMIRRNVEMEARLIDDLLDVTRIVRGKVELDRRPIRLCEVLRRSAEVCKPDLEARQLHFGVDVGDCSPCLVHADAGRLQQVFWNLLKNAVKFTPHGGCVGIRCRRDGEHVVTEVIDSGEGIAPHLLPHIFNPFEQGGARITRQFGGLGLGLTISKALVEMHGGTIEAYSEGRGKGATFRVRLPIHTASEPEPSATPRQRREAPAAQTRSLRILLVEDHGDTAKIMRRLLMAHGHQVQSAGDVSTALKLVEEQPFDLLLSDLGLPDGSGVDLIRHLREHGRTLPAIALSGYGQEEDVRRSKEAGFAAHLTKPTSPDQLIEMIGTVTCPGAALRCSGSQPPCQPSP